MPDADPSVIKCLEEKVRTFPSLGRVFNGHREPERVVFEVFQSFAPKILDNLRVEFLCHCKKERIRNLLAMLPIDELEDIKENESFPMETRCHHCNTAYYFDRHEIQQLYGIRFPNN